MSEEFVSDKVLDKYIDLYHSETSYVHKLKLADFINFKFKYTHPRAIINILKDAACIAQEKGNDEFFRKLMINISELNLLVGEKIEALNTLEDSLHGNSYRNTISLFNVLGLMYKSEGRNIEAFSYFKETYNLILKVRHEYYLGVIISNIANELICIGKYKKSLELYELSISYKNIFFKKENIPPFGDNYLEVLPDNLVRILGYSRILLIWISYLIMYGLIKPEHQEKIDCYYGIVKKSRKFVEHDTLEELYNLSRILLYSHQGNNELAEKYLEKVKGTVSYKVFNNLVLAWHYTNVKNYEKVVSILHLSLITPLYSLENICNKINPILYFKLLHNAYLKLGEKDNAIIVLNKIIAVAKFNKSRLYLAIWAAEELEKLQVPIDKNEYNQMKIEYNDLFHEMNNFTV